MSSAIETETITLGAKRETASQAGNPVSLEGIREKLTHLRINGVIEGTPGKTGVIVSTQEGNPIIVYRHPTWVLKPDSIEPGGIPTVEQYDSWKWEKVAPEKSAHNAQDILNTLKQGAHPDNYRMAIEFEGSAHDAVTGKLLPASHPKHPELNQCTYENATAPANTPSELAYLLGNTIKDFTIEHPAKILEMASVPQVGELCDIQINPHPYLQMAAPQVAALVKSIHPRAAYILGTILNHNQTVESFFRDYQLRLWPVAALHTHTGIPKSESWTQNHSGCDGRLGMQMLNTLYTVSMQICSLLDSSTVHFLGKKIAGVKDVRHSLRRLLPTANGGHPYNAYEKELPEWKEEYISGKIHSPSRYPVIDQHGVGRPRTELQTVESTNTGMHPHLGIQLALASITRLHTIAAIESIALNPTDTVFARAQQKYGLVMTPTTPDAMVNIESIFDDSSWDGHLEISGKSVTLRDIAYLIARNFLDIGDSYPTLKTDSLVAAGYLIGATHFPSSLNLSEYFDPNSSNFGIGCLTDRTTLIPEEDIWLAILTESDWVNQQTQLCLKNPNQILLPPNLINLLKKEGFI